MQDKKNIFTIQQIYIQDKNIYARQKNIFTIQEIYIQDKKKIYARQNICKTLFKKKKCARQGIYVRQKIYAR